MLFAREPLVKTINAQFQRMAGQIRVLSRLGLNDANIFLEGLMMRFFRAMYGWDLINLNLEQANYPAVDLGDKANRISVQVTSQSGADKITHTRQKAQEHHLGKDFDRIILFFLTEKKPALPKNFTQLPNGPEIECWDIKDVLDRLIDDPHVTVDQVQAAAQVLNEELGPLNPVPATGPSLHQLPPVPDAFTGRTADLAKLRALAPDGGTVLTGLRGMGGIGKTALALVLAHEWSPRFPDAQLFLDGRGTHENPPSAADLMAKVIQAFQPTTKLPEEESELRPIYQSLLHEKRVLILLDNALGSEQAAPLIPSAASALIVTSRHSFMLGGRAAHNVDRLPDDEATALLRALYPLLTDTEAAELVRLCAGLPLALRLAGAHLAMDAEERRSQANVASYLQALCSGRLATLDADAADAGLVAITETLRLSEARLSESERAAWRKLAVFSASFDACAAEAIAGTNEALLTRFVRASLLDREEGERFKLHDLAIEYALERMTGEEVTTLRLSHAWHYTAIGNESERLCQQGKPVEGLALFDHERAHLEGAFGWLSGRMDEESEQVLMYLVKAVSYTSNLRFHPCYRLVWLEAQLAASRRLSNLEMETDALGNLCGAHIAIGNVRSAIECSEQALVIASKAGDHQRLGSIQGNLGLAHAALGDMRRAIACYGQSLAIAREIGDHRTEASALCNLGNAHADLGEARQTIQYHNQALLIIHKIGDLHGEGSILGDIGAAHCVLGEIQPAIRCFEASLAIARKIGDRRMAGNALGNLGNASRRMGETQQSIEYYSLALANARENGNRRSEGIALGCLGNAHAELGDVHRAIESYEQQLTIDREIGNRRGEGNALWNSALALNSLGKRKEAVSLANAALVIREAIEDPNATKVREMLAKWRSEEADNGVARGRQD